jgi:hypothetical protein
MDTLCIHLGLKPQAIGESLLKQAGEFGNCVDFYCSGSENRVSISLRP